MNKKGDNEVMRETMPASLTHLAETFKALSEPLRVRLLMLMLHAGEICVHECMTVTEHPQSTVSRHLGALYKNNWLDRRRQGVWIYYSVNQNLSEWKRQCIKSLLSSSSQEAWFLHDTRKLAELRTKS
ncbi:ArsR/SmtB family transcription factor [Magnetococcus sp. PR-3]|uniref:ArsR/SmtB family transcription factor n=1 Tax=Magnetococcus sp. PR-3 TaxID=3120355 RepID=UPI003FA57F69